MRLAISKVTAFVVIISLALVILSNPSPAAADTSSGITIITHGFEPPAPISNGALPGWVSEMAQVIKRRGNVYIPIYRIRYDKVTDTVLFQDDAQDGATDIDITQFGGAIILLDWVGVSNEFFEYSAQFVADRFFTYLFLQTHNGHYLAELPIHLIGHSRGASLNSRLALNLAANGILVEQVTTLDPHSVTALWANDLVPVTYSNVIFADNYYRTGSLDPLVPDGTYVAGAAGSREPLPDAQDLSNTIKGGDCNEHSQVHTYYHGTIPLSPVATDGDGCNIHPLWYQESTAREKTGYNFSRYANGLVARPPSGVNKPKHCS